ncbi:glycoside hydrolase [Paenibacillus sp. CC-CFT747]|nr:glycoside hydrolase [Paenibacillus sp. CC-CFT747]
MEDKWVGQLEGLYSIRSTDNGASWDAPVRISAGAAAVRGNAAELGDGSLVLATYGGNEFGDKMTIVRTTDRGLTWTLSAVLEHEDYKLQEPNLFLAPSGKLVAFIRTAPKQKGGSPETACPLLTAESVDGGKSWGGLTERPFYSPSPFHALRLRSGRVLVSYGYRLEPYGVRAFLLDAECGFEEVEETVLREDGLGTDIGYTSSVQLPDDSILITYYYYDESDCRYIAGTICRED